MQTVRREEKKREKRERKKGRKDGKKGRKERKKRKKKRRKGRVGLHSNKVGSFPTWETIGLGVFQWPWSLVPTWGQAQNSLNANRVHFLGNFDAKNGFLVQVKLAGKYVGCWIFVYYCSCL